MKCREVIRRLLEGRRGEQTDQVEHMHQCHDCRATADTMQALQQAGRAARSEDLSPGVALSTRRCVQHILATRTEAAKAIAWPLWSRVAMPAGAVAAALLIAGVLISRHAEVSTPPPAATPGAEALLPRPSPVQPSLEHRIAQLRQRISGEVQHLHGYEVQPASTRTIESRSANLKGRMATASRKVKAELAILSSNATGTPF